MAKAATTQYHRAPYGVMYREAVGPEFEGWSDGSLRDGWEAPLFDHDQARQVLDAYWSELGWDYDDIDDMFLMNAPPGTDESVITVGGQWIHVPGGRMRVYEIGWGWPWVRLDES